MKQNDKVELMARESTTRTSQCGLSYKISSLPGALELRSSLSARIKSTEYAKELRNYFFFPLGIPYQPKGIQKGLRQLLRALPT